MYMAAASLSFTQLNLINSTINSAATIVPQFVVFYCHKFCAFLLWYSGGFTVMFTIAFHNDTSCWPSILLDNISTKQKIIINNNKNKHRDNHKHRNYWQMQWLNTIKQALKTVRSLLQKTQETTMNKFLQQNSQLERHQFTHRQRCWLPMHAKHTE